MSRFGSSDPFYRRLEALEAEARIQRVIDMGPIKYEKADVDALIAEVRESWTERDALAAELKAAVDVIRAESDLSPDDDSELPDAIQALIITIRGLQGTVRASEEERTSVSVERDALAARVAELEKGVEAGGRAALACQISAADLVAIGDLCAIHDDEYPKKAVERIVAERRSLLEAVTYMLRRIGEDPDVFYYCGSMTQAFRLLCESYARATGRTAKDVEAEVEAASNACNREAEVLVLRDRIRELQG